MAYPGVAKFANELGLSDLIDFEKNLDESTINSYKSKNSDIASNVKDVLALFSSEISSIISINWQNKSGVKTKDVVDNIIEGLTRVHTSMNTTFATLLTKCLSVCSFLGRIEEQVNKLNQMEDELSKMNEYIYTDIKDEEGNVVGQTQERNPAYDNLKSEIDNLEEAIETNCRTADSNISGLKAVNSENLQIIDNVSSGTDLPKATIAEFKTESLDFVEPEPVRVGAPELPKEEKTGEEKTGEEKPGEEKPGEEKPGEENPGEENPGEENPGEENPGEEKPGEENPGEENPGEENPGEEKAIKVLSLDELRKMQSEVYSLFKNSKINSDSDFSSSEVKEFIKKAKEYEQSVYTSYENGKIKYTTMQSFLRTLTDMETGPVDKNATIYHQMWDSKLGNTDEGDIVWTSERGIRANMVFYDRIENFKDHPEWLGDYSYQEIFNSSASYDEIMTNLKHSTEEGNQNFFALQAFISIKNDLYNGNISVEEAMQRTKDVGENSYIWDPKTQFTNRTVLGSVYQALCGDKIIGLESENEAIIPQMEKYQNAANALGYNN